MVNHKSLIEGLVNKPSTNKQLSNAELVETSLRRNEAVRTTSEARRAQTGEYTGRSLKDRFIVRDSVSDSKIDWGEVNQRISQESFDKLFDKVTTYLNDKEELFVFNGYAG